VGGFPAKGKDLKADGTLTTATGRQPIAVTIHQSDPTKKLPDRIGKATEITLNAVIFRAPDTELTNTGRYIDYAEAGVMPTWRQSPRSMAVSSLEVSA
jgi:hypothetical protein